jgi:hypothetical protein
MSFVNFRHSLCRQVVHGSMRSLTRMYGFVNSTLNWRNILSDGDS